MQVGELLAALTAPQAIALVELAARAGSSIMHRLADSPPADLEALRDRLRRVPIVDTDAAISEGRAEDEAGAGPPPT